MDDFNTALFRAEEKLRHAVDQQLEREELHARIGSEDEERLREHMEGVEGLRGAEEEDASIISHLFRDCASAQARRDQSSARLKRVAAFHASLDHSIDSFLPQAQLQFTNLSISCEMMRLETQEREAEKEENGN